MYVAATSSNRSPGAAFDCVMEPDIDAIPNARRGRLGRWYVTALTLIGAVAIVCFISRQAAHAPMALAVLEEQ
jgi:hypothetical protein